MVALLVGSIQSMNGLDLIIKMILYGELGILFISSTCTKNLLYARSWDSTGNETGPLSHEETRTQQNGNNLIARLSLRHSLKQRVISSSWVLPWQIGLLGHGSGPNHRILRELLLQSPETQGDSRGFPTPNKQTNKQR